MSVLTTPFPGIGATLGYKLSGSSTFTSVGQLNDDFAFDNYTTSDIPTNTIATRYATFSPGRVDYGSMTGTVYFVMGDATIAELHTMQQSGITCAWQVQLPDGSSGSTGTTLPFSGYINTLSPGPMTGEDMVKMGFSIKITGEVVPVVGT